MSCTQIDFGLLRGSTKRITQLEYRIEILRAQMESATAAYDGAKVQTTRKDLLAEQIAQLDEWQCEIERQRLELLSERRRASAIFRELAQTECEVMSRRYIDNQSWSKIEREMNYSHSHLMRIHKEAQQAIREI